MPLSFVVLYQRDEFTKDFGDICPIDFVNDEKVFPSGSSLPLADTLENAIHDLVAHLSLTS